MPPSARALLARLVRARHLVVVGHGDRAQPGRLGRVEQRVDRRGAVVRVVGVHVQVHVDEVAPLQALAHRGLALRPGGGARRSPRRAPRTRRRCGSTRARGAPRRSARAAAPPARRRAAGARAGRPGSPRRAARTAAPARPRPAASSYWGSRDATGTAPPASARSSSWGAGAVPAEAATAMLARARCWASEPSAGPAKRTRSRSRRGSGGGASAAGSRSHTVARPVELVGQLAQRAQEQPQRAALLLGGEHDLRAALAGFRAAPGGRRPGGSPGSRRGRSAPRCSRVAANAAVRPSRRPNSRSTSGRATWVDTNRSVGEWNVPTFSAREWRSAALAALGANGSCTCTKSSSARSMKLLDRARHVQRQRHRAAAAEGQALARRPARSRSPPRRTRRRGPSASRGSAPAPP